MVERALEIAALMLGNDKSRGYSLEMICADFLAGAVLETENSIQGPECSASIRRSAATCGRRILQKKRDERPILRKRPRIRVAAVSYARLRKEILERDNWRRQVCGRLKNLDVHHIRRRSALGDDSETDLMTICRECHQALHRSSE